MTNSEISYAEAQNNLDVLLDRVADDKDIIVIQRNGKSKNVALIAEEDLNSLMETVKVWHFKADVVKRLDLLA
jgi:prevent-host-death family protein